jgi:hypothetical protein
LNKKLIKYHNFFIIINNLFKSQFKLQKLSIFVFLTQTRGVKKKTTPTHTRKQKRGKMAGLLAWAADVVGAGGSESASEDSSIPILFSESQKTYVRELDHKANSLQRSIQDLRLRLPPPDISQRLPHLHAHSLASNNALALQLNAHSSTRHQVLGNYVLVLQ